MEGSQGAAGELPGSCEGIALAGAVLARGGETRLCCILCFGLTFGRSPITGKRKPWSETAGGENWRLDACLHGPGGEDGPAVTRDPGDPGLPRQGDPAERR